LLLLVDDEAAAAFFAVFCKLFSAAAKSMSVPGLDQICMLSCKRKVFTGAMNKTDAI
jgi:hypothetical protein